MRIFVAIALCCVPLTAQTPPDAAAILERQGALFQTSATLQYTQTMEVDMNLPGNATTQSTFQFAQPNRIRMEANSGGIGNIILSPTAKRPGSTCPPSSNTHAARRPRP